MLQEQRDVAAGTTSIPLEEQGNEKGQAVGKYLNKLITLLNTHLFKFKFKIKVEILVVLRITTQHIRKQNAYLNRLC